MNTADPQFAAMSKKYGRGRASVMSAVAGNTGKVRSKPSHSPTKAVLGATPQATGQEDGSTNLKGRKKRIVAKGVNAGGDIDSTFA